MPRYTSDAETVIDCYRLDLSWLRQWGVLRLGAPGLSRQWGKRSPFFISYEVLSGTEEHYLHLTYTVKGTKRSQWIRLVLVPSNLPGVSGHRYLMICPVSGRRATVLLLRDGTTQFAHRLAYGPKRLYYPSQLVTPAMRGYAQIFAEDEAWEKAWRKGRKLWYLGEPTKWHAHLLRLGHRINCKGICF